MAGIGKAGAVIATLGLAVIALRCGGGARQVEGGADAATAGPAPTAAAPEVKAPENRAPSAEAEAAPDLPPGLALRDLDPTELKALAEILREQFDPCGGSRTFDAALRDPAACPAARAMAELVIARLADGWSRKQATQALLEALARRAKRATFNLSDAPCTGEIGPQTRVIVEFSDFECPHCAKAFRPVKELAARHGAVLCAKHLPIDTHPLARAAAHAAHAAHLQGRYWDYAAELFARQDALEEAIFPVIARELGLDLKRFEADRASPATAEHVAADVTESELARAEGTPAFYVDGIQTPFEALEDALKDPSGVPDEPGAEPDDRPEPVPAAPPAP
jgi:protein-disulfide isomerase